MKKAFKVGALAGLLITSGAQAEIVFNGFANIVAGVTTDSDKTLYGYDDSVDFKNGSLVALQASSDLGNGLGVTAQIISRGEDDWDADFEWAYVSYDFNENFRVLAGKQRIPFYMYSDYLDVSYAYPWITPPESVYSVPFSTFEGLGAIYTTQLGEFDTSVHMIYGSNSDNINAGEGNVEPDFKDLAGITFTFTRDWLTLRAAYLQTEMNIPQVEGGSLEALTAGWEAAGFDNVADHLTIKDDTGEFFEAGFQIDYDNFLLIGEYTTLSLDETPIADQDSYFVTAGYRMNSWLFHVTYGSDDDKLDNFVSKVPSGVDPTLDYLKGTTEYIINDTREKQTFVTVGTRWDFHDSAALKFEYTNNSVDNASADRLDKNDTGLFRTALVTVF